MEKLSQSNYEYYEDINLAIVNYVPSDSLILDVGCGYGALGEAIKNKGNHVVGLEVNKTAIEVASKRLNEVYQVNISDFSSVPDQLKNKKFDVIVFADILEHLYDPFTTFQNYCNLLKPGGRVIVSLPNAVVWDIRIKFLFGIFNYTDTGTCDRTHIRFFTLSSMKRLIDSASFRILKEDFNPGLLRPFLPLIKNILNRKKNTETSNPRAILENPLYKAYMKFGYPIEKFICSINKRFFAFQFVVVAERK